MVRNAGSVIADRGAGRLQAEGSQWEPDLCHVAELIWTVEDAL